ncbi:hypothetical protein [Staphylococcus aureus]
MPEAMLVWEDKKRKAEIEFIGLTEENSAINVFIDEYYSDGDFYEDI